MITYKKENGFPIDVTVETFKHQEVMEDDEIWEGYKSVVLDSKGKEIANFAHGAFRDRLHWVDGFMKGIQRENR